MLDKQTSVLFTRDRNGEEELCGRPTGLQRKLTAWIAANTTFCVAVRLSAVTMTVLTLLPRQNMAAPKEINFPSTSAMPGPAPPVNIPPTAPNKLNIYKDLEVSQFKVTDF
jgi:hypothetical protein